MYSIFPQKHQQKYSNGTMNTTIQFVKEEGRDVFNDVTLYALSTCGFCKRALQFLRERKIRFRYVFVDELDPEVKHKLKESLAAQFNQRVGFPFVIINNSRCVVGFTQHEWEELFTSGGKG